MKTKNETEGQNQKWNRNKGRFVNKPETAKTRNSHKWGHIRRRHEPRTEEPERMRSMRRLQTDACMTVRLWTVGSRNGGSRPKKKIEAEKDFFTWEIDWRSGFLLGGKPENSSITINFNLDFFFYLLPA